MKRISCALPFWASVLFSLGLLMAQETTNAPIRISDTELHSVTLTNVSSKGIVAYVLQLHYAGLTGNLKSITSKHRSMAPGETWRHRIDESSRLKIGSASGGPALSPTTPPRVELSYVLFSDRTSWGTDPQGKYAEGMYSGCQDVNQFLKELWKQKGIGAVEDYLSLRSLP